MKLNENLEHERNPDVFQKWLRDGSFEFVFSLVLLFKNSLNRMNVYKLTEKRTLCGNKESKFDIKFSQTHNHSSDLRLALVI